MQMPFDADSGVSDDALLVAFGNGDQQAARTLTSRLAPRAYAVANRLLGDTGEAEDVAQEAMMRLWKIAPDWRQGEAKVSTWLYRVVVNLTTDRLRKRRSVGLDTIAEPEDPAPQVDEVMMATARRQALEAAIATLPDRQREAVVLRHIDGLANPEIADILGISVEAVESLTARAKRGLASALEGRAEELGFGHD